MGDKLSFAESNLGNDNEQVQFLKKYYSLLQIKDYLLGKKVLDTCGYKKRPIYMIYMYPSKTDCPDCVIQSGVLSKLREKYPELKVYTFDYDISLGPVETLKGIYKTKAEFPLLIIEDKPYYGLQTFDNIEKLLPNKLKDTIKSTPSSITVNKTKVINNKSTTSTSSSTGDKNNSIFANIFNTKSETVDPVNNNINTHSTNTGDIN
ncbi:MAG: hypothetical protein QM532_02670 [Cyanobium sp. MAG06]|nr:hypothetical protein [Cyanobium sp. MAG06]